jgi:hypothetical protein
LICWLVCFCLWSCHSLMLTNLLGLVYIAADDCLDYLAVDVVRCHQRWVLLLVLHGHKESLESFGMG